MHISATNGKQIETHLRSYDVEGVAGEQIQLKCYLRTDDSEKLPGKLVKFYLKEGSLYRKIGESRTDSSGYAKVYYTFSNPGEYYFYCKFDGDSVYKDDKTSNKRITVKGTTQYVVKVKVRNNDDDTLHGVDLYIDGNFKIGIGPVNPGSLAEFGIYKLSEGEHVFKIKWYDPDTKQNYEKNIRVNILGDAVVTLSIDKHGEENFKIKVQILNSDDDKVNVLLYIDSNLVWRGDIAPDETSRFGEHSLMKGKHKFMIEWYDSDTKRYYQKVYWKDISQEMTITLNTEKHESTYAVKVRVKNYDDDGLSVKLYIDGKYEGSLSVLWDKSVEFGPYKLSKGYHTFKITWTDPDVGSGELQKRIYVSSDTTINFEIDKPSSGKPDLILEDISAPSTAYAGKGVKVTFKVKNQGDGDSRLFVVKAYLSKSPGTRFDYYLNCYATVDELKAGASVYASPPVYCTIPGSISPGTYYLIGYVDANRYVEESNEQNNIKYKKIEILTTEPTTPAITTTTPKPTPTTTTAVTTTTVVTTPTKKYTVKIGVLNKDDDKLWVELYIDGVYQWTESIEAGKTVYWENFELKEGYHTFKIRWYDYDTREYYPKEKEVKISDDVTVTLETERHAENQQNLDENTRELLLTLKKTLEVGREIYEDTEQARKFAEYIILIDEALDTGVVPEELKGFMDDINLFGDLIKSGDIVMKLNSDNPSDRLEGYVDTYAFLAEKAPDLAKLLLGLSGAEGAVVSVITLPATVATTGYLELAKGIVLETMDWHQYVRKYMDCYNCIHHGFKGYLEGLIKGNKPDDPRLSMCNDCYDNIQKDPNVKEYVQGLTILESGEKFLIKYSENDVPLTISVKSDENKIYIAYSTADFFEVIGKISETGHPYNPPINSLEIRIKGGYTENGNKMLFSDDKRRLVYYDTNARKLAIRSLELPKSQYIKNTEDPILYIKLRWSDERGEHEGLWKIDTKFGRVENEYVKDVAFHDNVNDFVSGAVNTVVETGRSIGNAIGAAVNTVVEIGESIGEAIGGFFKGF